MTGTAGSWAHEPHARPAWWAPAAVGVAAAGGAALVGLVTPRGQAFYPQCPLYRLTGVYCPACGATRAVHELVTGHLVSAAHDNILLLVAVPVLALLWWGWFSGSLGRRPRLALRLPAWWWQATIAVMVLYGVARNIPVGPFRALAPLA